MNVLRSALLGIALSSAGAPGGAGAQPVTPPVTRYVLTYSGPDSAWEIDRGTASYTPKNGFVLAAGDCIVLRSTSAAAPTMTAIVDGREIVVNKNQPRFCVVDEPQPSAVELAIARTFSSLANVFHTAERGYDSHRTAALTTRRAPTRRRPALPLLAGNGQRLGEGTRTLAIVWLATKPPYRVSLSPADRSATGTTITTTQARARLGPLGFKPGSYTIVVSDAAHVTVRQRFTVVSAADVPAPSTDVATVLSDESTTADVRAAYDAARLIAEPSDAWRFEAYQRVVGHGAGSALAQRLIDELEHGG